MRGALHKAIFAGFLLTVLLTAIVGQKVHIYTEDPLHFAAFCDKLVTDNGADCRVVERCVVDNFYFFPCICTEVQTFDVTFELLGSRADQPTSPKQNCEGRIAPLRAPPTA